MREYFLFSVLRNVCNGNRIAGAALIAPVVNYWWTGFPANVSKEAYNLQPWNDQWALRVTHYTPWLTYWWNTQKWFLSSSAIAHNPDVFSTRDKELAMKPNWQSRKAYAVPT